MNPDVTRLLNILAQTASPPPLPPLRQQQQLLQLDPRLQKQQLHSYAAAAAAPPPVDPKTITDWPTALRYVMDTLAKDEAVMAQIKKMKKHQHDHEKMWWAAREEIVRKHEARVQGNQKVQDLLRRLGTLPSVQIASNLPTPESEKEELRTFDQKVHLRSTDMVTHMASEFAQMGVPFFCRGPLGRADGPEMAVMRARIVELLEDLAEGWP